MNSEVNVLCCYESWLLQAVEERKVSTKKIRFLVVFSLLGSCRVLELQAQSQEKYQLVKCRKGVFVLPSCDLECLFIYCLQTSHCNALDFIKLFSTYCFSTAFSAIGKFHPASNCKIFP